MNPICERSAKYDVVKVSGKPNPPKNQATVSKFSVSNLLNVDPQATPVSMYTKKAK